MARTCPTPRPPDPPPDRDVEAVAWRLDAIAEEAGWGGPPLLLGLTADGADDVAPPAPLPGSAGTDPSDLVASLVGFDAPSDWEALAVVVHGRAWSTEPDADRADPRPVRLTHVVDRLGRSASVMRQAGDDPVLGGADGHGRLVDVCRRCLGLATAPAPADATAFWALVWMDHLLARAARGERPRRLADAARAHPAIEMVARNDPDMVATAVANVARLGPVYGGHRDWPHLRRAAAAGEWPVEDLGPEGAAWMDDGMFARWVTADYPTLDDYLPELERLLPEKVVSGVLAVLAEWDLVPAR